MPASKNLDWGTPRALFDALDAEFGPFDLDPCGQREVHYTAYRIHSRGGRFFDGSCAAMDGLLQPWECEAAYVNPPYGRRMPQWIQKAAFEIDQGNAKRIVMLIPSRTDTKAWQTYILKEAAYDRIAAPENIELVRFLPGRLKFEGAGKDPAPFPSAVVVWRKA